MLPSQGSRYRGARQSRLMRESMAEVFVDGGERQKRPTEERELPFRYPGHVWHQLTTHLAR